MGCICTYASYYSRHTKLLNSAVQIGVIDTCVAILAGLMIFPAAFSVGVSPDSGPSLIFTCARLCYHTLVEVGLSIPNIVAEQFAES